MFYLEISILNLEFKLKAMFKKFVIAFCITVSLYIFTVPVSAQCAENWLPEVIQEYVCNPNPEQFAESRVRALFTIAVGVIILVAIAMALRASFKLITSGGDKDKMDDAFNGVKAIFLGIASIFLIMLAIPLVLGFFGYDFNQMSSGLLICVRAPESAGCYACMHKELENEELSNRNLCSICDQDSSQTINTPLTETLTSNGYVNCTEPFE